MKNILVVDDDAEVRATVEDVLKGAGYNIKQAASAMEALERISAGEFHVILLDLMMPGMSGIDLLPEIRRISPRSKVIIVTAFATVENAVDAIKKGASDYISKPFKIEDMLNVISRVLEEARFEEGMKKLYMDTTLGALSNSVRRKIIKLLHERRGMRLMELTRELKLNDHTKAVFHMKYLADAGLVDRSRDRVYSLTKEGEKMLECLRTVEKYMAGDSGGSS